MVPHIEGSYFERGLLLGAEVVAVGLRLDIGLPKRKPNRGQRFTLAFLCP
jgi:hypothetical protein